MTRRWTMNDSPDLRVDIGGLVLKNPVMTASGTFGYGREFAELVDLKRLGAVVVKGLSLQPSMGNPPPRIAETACGMLNAIGLENVGVDAFIREKLPFLETLSVPVIVNIYGKSVEEYAELAGRLDPVEGVSAVEVNISCPNVKAGGVAFGVDPEAAYTVVREVRLRTARPLIVKLSPNVSDVTKIAEKAVDAGADALSLINTITGMAVDVERRRPKLANVTGGLSGPAVKPVALRMVWEVVKTVNVPVIGIGGIMTAEDALEFLITGAAAVEVGTANFVNPGATMDILDGIEAYLVKHGIEKVTDLIGTLET
ncbi:MAG: dihydroorotate dehydrogenase [Desulfobacterales bacterium]|nr:dihydroorotate dehydrogenase [Desulfobacterales bacterium]